MPGLSGPETSRRGCRGQDCECVCSAPMELTPVTVTFPAVPEYLRLARIATADAASRAGLDYEEIDDVRIAVSEFCSLLSVDPGSMVTLAFHSADGSLIVEGEARTGRSEVIPN